jgi:hypothetical protein
MTARQQPRNHHGAVPSQGLNLDIRCSCGGTLKGVVSPPTVDAFEIRDIFLSFHRDDGCVVAEKNTDVHEAAS